jgi:hypothetical protein
MTAIIMATAIKLHMITKALILNLGNFPNGQGDLVGRGKGGGSAAIINFSTIDFILIHMM